MKVSEYGLWLTPFLGKNNKGQLLVGVEEVFPYEKDGTKIKHLQEYFPQNPNKFVALVYQDQIICRFGLEEYPQKITFHFYLGQFTILNRNYGSKIKDVNTPLSKMLKHSAKRYVKDIRQTYRLEGRKSKLVEQMEAKIEVLF